MAYKGIDKDLSALLARAYELSDAKSKFHALAQKHSSIVAQDGAGRNLPEGWLLGWIDCYNTFAPYVDLWGVEIQCALGRFTLLMHDTTEYRAFLNESIEIFEKAKKLKTAKPTPPKTLHRMLHSRLSDVIFHMERLRVYSIERLASTDKYLVENATRFTASEILVYQNRISALQASTKSIVEFDLQTATKESIVRWISLRVNDLWDLKKPSKELFEFLGRSDVTDEILHTVCSLIVIEQVHKS